MIFNFKKAFGVLGLMSFVALLGSYSCKCLPPKNELRSIHVMDSTIDPLSYFVTLYNEAGDEVKSIRISVLGSPEERVSIPHIYKEDSNFEEVKNAIYNVSDINSIIDGISDDDPEEYAYWSNKKYEWLEIIFRNFNI